LYSQWRSTDVPSLWAGVCEFGARRPRTHGHACDTPKAEGSVLACQSCYRLSPGYFYWQERVRLSTCLPGPCRALSSTRIGARRADGASSTTLADSDTTPARKSSSHFDGRSDHRGVLTYSRMEMARRTHLHALVPGSPALRNGFIGHELRMRVVPCSTTACPL